MYTIHGYGEMIADARRMQAFDAAIRARVGKDSVVLDIGAGAGIMTLLACRAGARRVYAVEPDGVVQSARELVAVNGYADRVEFFEALSTAIDLPERVDVIVSDLRGAQPCYGAGLISIIDARDRFLKPSGRLIAQRDDLCVALVSAPDGYRRIVEPWETQLGFEGAPARRRAVNVSTRWRPNMGRVLTGSQVWSSIDYERVGDVNVKGRAAWTMEKPRTAHGLCVWFDCETAEGVRFSNAPIDGVESVYGQTFFPWTAPCDLAAGDRVVVDLRADHVGQDYVWSWNAEITADGSTRPKAAFRQSHFLGAPISAEWLRKSSSEFVPAPNEEVAIDRMILDLLFTGLALEGIARKVSNQFPDKFPQWRNALTRVGEWSVRYAR